MRNTTRLSDRDGIRYSEHARISIQDGAVMENKDGGADPIPVEMIHALVLGPGTSLTHHAMRACMRGGCSVAWTSSGTGFLDGFASATLSHSTDMPEAQAEVTAIRKQRLEAARTLLRMRFGEEPDTRLSENQLRGWEGTRMKRLYRDMSVTYGVPWAGRVTDGADDAVNSLISKGNAILYTSVQIAIMSLNLSPALGILHRGYRRSFIFDIADIYKPEAIIEPVFRMVAAGVGHDDAIKVLEGNVHRIVWPRVTSDVRKALLW